WPSKIRHRGEDHDEERKKAARDEDLAARELDGPVLLEHQGNLARPGRRRGALTHGLLFIERDFLQGKMCSSWRSHDGTGAHRTRVSLLRRGLPRPLPQGSLQ